MVAISEPGAIRRSRPAVCLGVTRRVADERTVKTYVSAWPGIWVIDTSAISGGRTDGGHPAPLLAGRAGAAQAAGPGATVRDVRREILASLRSALIFSLLGTAVFVAARQGWITIYHGFDEAGPLYLALSLAFMLIAHDT